jgi:hypothetical protein
MFESSVGYLSVNPDHDMSSCGSDPPENLCTRD